jgi:hypothetical protein
MKGVQYKIPQNPSSGSQIVSCGHTTAADQIVTLHMADVPKK